MTVLTRIHLMQPELAHMQQKMAAFILSEPEQVLSLSSAQLALQVGASQSAVVKFSQKLGFSGFPALKLALSEELGRNQAAQGRYPEALHNRIERGDTLGMIAQKLALEKTYSINETTRRLDVVLFEQAIECLTHAQRIQIVGIGGSGLAARDLSYKLQKIGMTTLVEADHHVQITVAQTLGPRDAQIVISFSGNRKDMLVAARVAKNQGAKLIVITGDKKSRLGQLADYVLESVADENAWRSSSIASRSAQNTLTDLLFIALLQRREATARELVLRARTMIDSLDE